MRLKYNALGCAILLLIVQSAQAQLVPTQGPYDAVDALFAAGPAGDSLTTSGAAEADTINTLGVASAGLPAAESAPFSEAPLTRLDDQPDTDFVAADIAPSAGTPPKSKTSWPIDSVPEPSALAMGAVALMFFLFFARRRQQC